MILKMIFNVYFRLLIYFALWQLYIVFMSLYAPMGTSWIDWYYQRQINMVEFIKLHGYFSQYGFSISSNIKDAYLNIDHPIYLSSLAILSSWHYFIINHFFGIENFKLYGQLVDKTIIFITGCLFCELYLKLLKQINLKNLIKVFFLFFIFIISPWTYKMIIFPWLQIHFILFYLMGIFFILKKKQKLGLLSIFFGSTIDYQSAAIIGFFYIFLVVFFFSKKKFVFIQPYFSVNYKDKFINYKIITCLVLPVIIYIVLRLLAANEFKLLDGSSILTRIGISGNDPGNGSLLGALQFLAGNRINVCFAGFSENWNFTSNLPQLGGIYNCILSLASIFLVSLISIFGLYISYKNRNSFFKLIIIPFLFLIMSFTFVLQQSSSVHLMGYSYIFSILFSVGIVNLLFKILEKYNFSVISILLAMPLTIGIILLCIRVSMLTGING